jgi:hypothetical protein
MLKMMLIGTTLAALLSGTASAQEQAAVQLPDAQTVHRMQELLRRAEHRNYYNYYDAFGTISVLAAQDTFAGGLAATAGDPRPLAEGEAQIP